MSIARSEDAKNEGLIKKIKNVLYVHGKANAAKTGILDIDIDTNPLRISESKFGEEYNNITALVSAPIIVGGEEKEAAGAFTKFVVRSIFEKCIIGEIIPINDAKIKKAANELYHNLFAILSLAKSPNLYAKTLSENLESILIEHNRLVDFSLEKLNLHNNIIDNLKLKSPAVTDLQKKLDLYLLNLLKLPNVPDSIIEFNSSLDEYKNNLEKQKNHIELIDVIVNDVLNKYESKKPKIDLMLLLTESLETISSPDSNLSIDEKNQILVTSLNKVNEIAQTKTSSSLFVTHHLIPVLNDAIHKVEKLNLHKPQDYKTKNKI